MCGSVGRVLTGVATGGVSEVARGAKKVAEAPARKAVRDQEEAVQSAKLRKEAIATQKKQKLKKVGKTRSQQIARFGANVASGGAKRAANV